MQTREPCYFRRGAGSSSNTAECAPAARLSSPRMSCTGRLPVWAARASRLSVARPPHRSGALSQTPQPDVVPGVQHPNVVFGELMSIGMPLQHGTQLAVPWTQAKPVVALQQPPPQPTVPGGRAPASLVQPASQVGGDWLFPQTAPLFAGAVNAHPQPPDPGTPQQPLGSPAVVVPHWAPAQEEEHPGFSVGSGHDGSLLHVLTEPPTLQRVFWQQQQQPATAPAPEETPQESVEKSAHWRFVGESWADAEGTAIE